MVESYSEDEEIKKWKIINERTAALLEHEKMKNMQLET
jgi:hypothetical protein